MKCLSWFTWIEFELFERESFGHCRQKNLNLFFLFFLHIIMNLLQILMIFFCSLVVSSFLCLRHKWMYDAGAVSEWRMFKHTGKFPLHLQTWLCIDRKDTLHRWANLHVTHIYSMANKHYIASKPSLRSFFTLTINSNSWAGALLSYGYGSREMWARSSNTPFPGDMLLHCG